MDRYSVWFKPAELMSQGTMFGDHCSALRYVEIFFQMKRKVFLIHRLDREASGLMIIAHTKEAAARFSELFRTRRISKGYRIDVAGDLGGEGKTGRIDFPLDSKKAVTEYTVEAYNSAKNITRVSVVISTGRMHQIRRHFEIIGHPVMGDPRYGTGNKNREGMRLDASSLEFICPFKKTKVRVTSLDHLPEDKAFAAIPESLSILK